MTQCSGLTRRYMPVLFLLFMIPFLTRPAPSAADAEIQSDVVGAAGGQAQSTSYKIHDTFGQGPIGPAATGTTIALQDGFWSAVGAGGAPGDTLTPASVIDFVVMPMDMATSLEWTNPSDIDFAGTLILYSTVGFPATVGDGTPVENGSGGVFDGAPGSDGEFEHSGLTNGTTYYYTAFAFDGAGNYAEGAIDSTTPYDGVPPGQVTVDAVVAGDGLVELSWTNPSDADFEYTLVKYSTSAYPSDPAEGTPVENGSDGIFEADPATPGSFIHTGLVNSTRYYYAFFAADEVPNYSIAATGTALPQDVEPPAPVAAFSATARDDGSVKLEWTNPDDIDFAGSLVRYSTVDYPASETDGTPVPNGANGRFGAAAATVDSFVHTGLTIGTTYYYSIFTYDGVPNYSDADTASAVPYDAIDPVLAISVFQNPYITNHLDVYLVVSEALIDSSVHCWIAGDAVSMALVDSDEHVWMSDYDLYSTGTISIRAEGRDSSLNWDYDTHDFSATLILASNGGTASSVDGHCVVDIPAGMVQADAYVLIFEEPSERFESGGFYEISPAGLAIGDFVEIAIVFDAGVLEPQHLCVARLDEGGIEPLESYVDTGTGRVITYADRLGSYGLLWRQDIETPEYGEGDLRVLQNVPNPFAGSTVIAFEVPRPGRICAEVVSIHGRLVRSLLDSSVIPGRRRVEWDGRDGNGNRVASGVYFYRVTYEAKTVTRKMVHLR
jgi:hypothetical protein